MNRLATLSRLLCGLILLVFIPPVGARDQDLRTIDQLIEKFERVYLQMAPEAETRLSVTLRLADLLAEKGDCSPMRSLPPTVANARLAKRKEKKRSNTIRKLSKRFLSIDEVPSMLKWDISMSSLEGPIKR